MKRFSRVSLGTLAAASALILLAACNGASGLSDEDVQATVVAAIAGALALWSSGRRSRA